jgi:hypothetical protein
MGDRFLAADTRPSQPYSCPRHGSTALRAAEATSGLSREDLAERIAEDPRLLPLVTRLLYVAGMNGHDGTLGAMGAVFGETVRNPNTVDEAELLLTALADLNDTHARVLRVMTELPPPLAGSTAGWSWGTIAEPSGLSVRIVGLCIATLIARGLVRTHGLFPGGGTTYLPTELGEAVIEALREHAGNGR